MTTLALFFARRYLFSKKSHSVINIISGVSAFAVSIPVAAMVILLSVFNGFETFIHSLHSHFDPDILISPVQGKVFVIDSMPTERISAVDGVEAISFTLQESAMFEYRDRQFIGTMKGVDTLFHRVVPIESTVAQGEYRLELGEYSEALVGQGLAYSLGLKSLMNDPLTIYTPQRGNIPAILPQLIYKKEKVYPSGIFVLDAEVDGQYLFVSLDLAQRMLDYPGKASALSLRLKPGADTPKVRAQIADLLGDEYRILTRQQQKETFYRIMMYEKWGIYLIILLVLIVASFSLIGSLVMLIMDKRKDMKTLITMGAELSLIRRIFFNEGLLIYAIGTLVGIIVGVLLALGQQHFGWIALQGETFLIHAYPVELRPIDLMWIVMTSGLVSVLIAGLTVRMMIPTGSIRPDAKNQ